MAILDRLEATLGCEHVSIDVHVNFTSFLRARPHTCWGSLGAQEAGPKFSRSGLAAEARALPCTFRRKSTIDFEEIERLYSLNEELSDPLVISHVVPGEAAGLKTPAASHRPLPSWVMFGGYFLVILLFVHYSFIIRSYSCIMQTKLSKRYITVSWGVFWVSWAHLGES